MLNLKSKEIIYVIVALDFMIIVGLLLLYKYKQKYIVNIRQALFSRISAQHDIFVVSPEILTSKYGFKTEPKQLKDEFYSLLEDVKYVQDSRKKIENQNNEIEKAKLIILLFQKEEEDKEAEFPSLLEKIRTFPKPDVYGDCSDNAEVFIALGSFFGLTVREVHNAVHVFSEIYDHHLRKWIWIDPENAIMAKNVKGEYLSLVEMASLYIKNEKIDYELFGKNTDPEMKKNYFYYYYSGKDKFSYVMMTLGNNIYEVDKLSRRMSFLPKLIREFIILVSNVKPHYVIYSSNRSVIVGWHFMKYLTIISACGIILINIALVKVL
jgi:hypothetical protein